MKFSEYFQLNETYLSELPSIASTYDVNKIQIFEIKIQDAGLDVAKMMIADDIGISYDPPVLSYVDRTNLINSLKHKVLKALVVIHEVEYKQSQIKKFYGGRNIDVNPSLMRLCQYVKHYLLGVMFLRAAMDVRNHVLDSEVEQEKIVNTDNRKLVPVVIQNMKQQISKWEQTSPGLAKSKADNYDYAYLELSKAINLPQLLIAISKALNAVHDSGPLLFNDPDGDNTLIYEPPFTKQDLDELSNLNYRYLDQELQDEFN